MARGRIKFEWNDKKLVRNVRDFEKTFDKMMRFIMDYHAAAAVTEMKANAPWTDDTGAARAGLFTVTQHKENHYTIVLSHTPHYGFWLEVKFSGRDAIVMPTVKSRGHALMSDIRKRIS